MTRMSKLQKALTQGMDDGADLAQEIYELGEYALADVEDCQALQEAIEAWDASRGTATPRGFEELQALSGLLQDVSSHEAYEYIRDETLPKLVEIFRREATPTARDQDLAELLFLLKLLAMFQSDEGIECLIEAVQSGFGSEEYLWEVIFQIFCDADHPAREYVANALREPLPRGFAAVTYLDFVNTLAREELLESHPFDTPEGLALLNEWLLDPDRFSYAHSAAASLPFLFSPERDSLMALAMEHVDSAVQLESAWASARLGGEGGVKLLARFAQDLPHAATAIEYLHELGRDDAIPESSREPDFQALAEMCQWLAHPNEFGEPPIELTLFDTRELFWPPTNDRRQVWLFRYRYPENEAGEAAEEGLGMVGSVTFSLLDEVTAAHSPEDAYALHCCWELEYQEDPRAPVERSIEAGREILQAAQDED